MSSKNFATALEGKDLKSKGSSSSITPLSTSTEKEPPNSRTRAMKGKKTNNQDEVIGNEESGDTGLGEGMVGEGGGETGKQGKAESDRKLDQPEENEKEDNNQQKMIRDLGPIIDTMEEEAHVELGHAKWINSIRTAFARKAESQYTPYPVGVCLLTSAHQLPLKGKGRSCALVDKQTRPRHGDRIFREEYHFWCEKEETEVRDIELMEFTYTPEKSTNAEKTDTTKEVAKSKVESNTIMNLGVKVTNNMPRLSKFFDDIMINKNVHMLVSIFDLTWILQDSLFMKALSSKNISCSSNVTLYIGSPVMNEFRLTQSEWSTRFNLMEELIYDVLDSQKDSPIAPRLRQHKENVLNIQIKSYGKWTPAMRYDIAHRRNVWENCLPDGSMADVGTLNEELVEQATEDAKHFDDYKYTNNPYALGSAKQNISPINGLTYPEHHLWDSPNALIETQADMLTGRSVSAVTGLPFSNPTAVIHNNDGIVKPYKNTYKGRHFNPYYSKSNMSTTYTYANGTHLSNNPGGSVTLNRGGRGQGQGGFSSRRGCFNGSATSGGNGRPAIGPGSFDLATVGKFTPGGGSGVAGSEPNNV